MSNKITYLISVDKEAAKIKDSLEREIFLEIMPSLIADNLDRKFNLRQLKAYCLHIATHDKLMAAVNSDFMIDGQKGLIVDTRLNQALRHLGMAMDIATRNGLTLKSRKTIGVGTPRPEPGSNGKKESIVNDI